jgi:vitamin B12 transporter
MGAILRIGILTLFFLYWYTDMYAQADTTATIEEITITHNRIQLGYKDQNRQVHVISKNEIMAAPVTSISELLQYAGGVDIRRRGPAGVQADIAIRGGNFEQTLVLLNGIRMSDTQTGHHTLYMPVNMADIERIEIIKGGASRMYGQNAFAGVVNIITKKSENTSMAGEVAVGSFNTQNVGLRASLPVGRSQHALSFSYQQSDGYRYNTDYKILNGFYQANTRLIGQDIQWMAGFTERRFGANGFYASQAFKDQYEEVQTSIVAVTTSISLNDKTTIVPKISWRRNQDMYLFVRDNPALYRNMHIGNNLTGELHLHHQNSLGTLGLGLDIARQALRSNNLGDRQRTVAGFFAEQHFSLYRQKISTTLGLYSQYTGDRSDNLKFYPGIDISYAVTDQIKVFSNIGYNNRLPSYTDLYYTSPAEQSNPNLTDESSWDTQLGFTVQKKSTILGITLFNKSSNNTIDWGKDSVNQTKWVVNNLAGITTRGLEMSIQGRLHPRVEYKLQYTWLDIIYDPGLNSVSRYVLNNLKHQIIGSTNVRWMQGRLTTGITARYNERIAPGALAELEGFSNHFLLDARINYLFKRFTAGFTLNNITDIVYHETTLVPMPGRWVNFVLGYRWEK